MSDELVYTTVPDVCRRGAERWPDVECLVDGELRLTYAQTWAAAERVGAAFVATGHQAGDRVAIWAPNVAEWVVAAVGAEAAGLVLVPINTRFKGEEAAYILERSGARTLLTVTGFLGIDFVGSLQGAGANVSDVAQVILRGDAPPGASSWETFLSAGDDPAAAAELDARLAALGPEDLSDLMFTSGTTGAPKAVMSTHGQSTRCYDDWSRIVGIREGDRYLVVNPFFHSFGYKAGWLAAMLRGATILPFAAFDAAQVLALAAKERVSVLPGPPTLFLSLLDLPGWRDYDRSSLRLTITGAANVPPHLIPALHDEVGFESVLTGYGLTEATGAATTCRPGDDLALIAESCGRALTDVECRIVDDDGATLAPGETGELVIRGYNVMQGYFGEEEATAEVIDADGWLHTGDVATMDAEGNVRITDRKKDMVIVGGFNVYPAEVEQVLLRHPDVANAAVVGAPDERMGEVPFAFVVPRHGHDLDGAALLAWTKERLANFKVPRHVETVDTLPVNASGKVLKFELRARAADVVAGG